ncbi:hypothetical protein [Zhongshania aquimaris]|uniref:Lipocalin-like domain-containing protein n=1 Tax=Zhongshania aquimaris TaxID=2857107 RepID=A0ABS6VVV6_9GAMM|nr:hypothetical protein [Zhongshania aquimaris]MBW2942469.1 hypothetical protein [Zhongshania aquimaris]
MSDAISPESMVGKWKVIVKGPTGAESSELDISYADGQFSGTQTGKGSTSDILEPSLDGNTFFWKNNVTKPMKIKTEFTATISGTSMSGKVKAGFVGKYPFTGEKL